MQEDTIHLKEIQEEQETLTLQPVVAVAEATVKQVSEEDIGSQGGDGLEVTNLFPSDIGKLEDDGGYWVGGGGGGTGPNPQVGGKGGGGKTGNNPGVDGVDGTGGGAGTQYSNPGGAGGDGIVVVSEAGAGPSSSSGMWTLKAQYTAIIDGNWPS